MPSLSVFSNWPTRRSPLGYVSALDLSPLSRYAAIGNDKGKVLLYRQVVSVYIIVVFSLFPSCRLNHYHAGNVL